MKYYTIVISTCLKRILNRLLLITSHKYVFLLLFAVQEICALQVLGQEKMRNKNWVFSTQFATEFMTEIKINAIQIS